MDEQEHRLIPLLICSPIEIRENEAPISFPTVHISEAIESMVSVCSILFLDEQMIYDNSSTKPSEFGHVSYYNNGVPFSIMPQSLANREGDKNSSGEGTSMLPVDLSNFISSLRITQGLLSNSFRIPTVS